MQLGMIGLGRMGGNMTTRLTEHGHDMKTYDPGVESTAKTLEELRDQLDAPRSFWMMVPAGKVTEDTFQTLLTLASAGDVIVDGGNSNFHDSQRRYAEAKDVGIQFVDAGVSGGVVAANTDGDGHLGTTPCPSSTSLSPTRFLPEKPCRFLCFAGRGRKSSTKPSGSRPSGRRAPPLSKERSDPVHTSGAAVPDW